MKDIKVINNVVSYNSGHYARERLKYILMAFDSVRQRICPYCGNEYHMENAGFIIEKLELS